MRKHHDPTAIGHSGQAKTLEPLQRKYYWPRMSDDVMRYIRNCHTCQRSRTSRHVTYGVLRALSIPDKPWQDISVDFVTGLPSSEGCHSICVIVDRFTMQRHILACNSTIDVEQFEDLFIKEVFPLHSPPQTVTSDRGPQFIAAFWRCLYRRLDMEVRLSSPYHPQTDGQTERFNTVMNQYLRCHVNHRQVDWTQWLPLAEFAANNQESASTTLTSFFANTGMDPRITTDLTQPASGDRDDIWAHGMATKMAEMHDFA